MGSSSCTEELRKMPVAERLVALEALLERLESVIGERVWALF